MVTTHDIDAVCREAEDLGRLLAPLDLAGVPLHVLSDDRLPEHLRCGCDCGGYTSPLLWAEVGLPPSACIVAAADALARTAPSAEEFRLAVLEVTVHELGHILSFSSPFRVPAAGIEATLRCLGEPPGPDFDRFAAADARRTVKPWADHGAEFVRIVLHLQHRARRLGVPVCPIAAGADYGLSSLDRYREALGNEPERFARLAFSEIKRLPPPRAFAALWEYDTHPRTPRETDPMKILDTILNRLAGRKRVAVESYGDLLDAVVRGDEPHAEDVEHILDTSGKTAADLETDVKARLHRIDLQRQVEAGKAATSDFAAVQTEVQRVSREHEQAEAKYTARMRGLAAQEEAARELMRQGKQAAQELRRTAPAELHRQQEDLHRRGAALITKRRELQDQARRIRGNRDLALAAGKQTGSEQQRQEYESDARGAEHRLALVRQHLDQLAADEKDLEQQGERLAEQMRSA